MTFEIDGMHCEACVRRVTASLAGAGAGAVNRVAIGQAEVQAPDEAAPAMLAALEKAGFSARLKG